MKVAFRVDSSLRIGSGHIMRCLTLADGLRDHGCETLFVCRALKGNVISLIRERRHDVHVLSQPGGVVTAVETVASPRHSDWLEVLAAQDARETISVFKKHEIEWLIVDHYALDYRWHGLMRPYVDKIMVIDDLADRRYDCDMLLDQTYGRTLDEYLSLAPGCKKILLGSRYALLRPQFAECRSEALKRRASMGQIKRILICFGGMDPNNMSSVALQGVEGAGWATKLEVDVVLGQKSPYYETVFNLADNSNLSVNVFSYVDDMARLMLDADLAIGAGGTITWERCCLGLPCLALIAAENQKTIIEILDKQGALKNLGWLSAVTEKTISDYLTILHQDHHICQALSEKAFMVCDGLGLRRVVDEIRALSADRIALRKAGEEDCEIIFQWQSCPCTREYSRNPRTPSRDEHEKWFKTKMGDKNCLLYIIENRRTPVGYVRLDRMDTGTYTYEISVGIAPDLRGKGFAKKALMALRRMRPRDIFKAEVHKNNRASNALFKALSYQKTGDRWFVSRPVTEGESRPDSGRGDNSGQTTHA